MLIEDVTNGQVIFIRRLLPVGHSMSNIRNELVYAEINRAYFLTDFNIYNDMFKQFKFQKQTVLADNSLTDDEKTEAIRLLNRDYDRDKVINNSGTKKNCEIVARNV
jgi:hypothetical protein